MAYVVVYTTAKDLVEGRTIAKHLLTQKLVACVNIVNGIESHYRWDGKLEQSPEVLLIIKTRKTLFSKLVKEVKKVHSYKVPEIMALPIVAGDKKYLAWVKDETR